MSPTPAWNGGPSDRLVDLWPQAADLPPGFAPWAILICNSSAVDEVVRGDARSEPTPPALIALRRQSAVRVGARSAPRSSPPSRYWTRTDPVHGDGEQLVHLLAQRAVRHHRLRSAHDVERRLDLLERTGSGASRSRNRPRRSSAGATRRRRAQRSVGTPPSRLFDLTGLLEALRDSGFHWCAHPRGQRYSPRPPGLGAPMAHPEGRVGLGAIAGRSPSIPMPIQYVCFGKLASTTVRPSRDHSKICACSDRLDRGDAHRAMVLRNPLTAPEVELLGTEGSTVGGISSRRGDCRLIVSKARRVDGSAP